MRTHIDWARWDRGPAASLCLWIESSTVDTELLALELGIRHGVVARMVEIDAAIPPSWHAVLRGELPFVSHTTRPTWPGLGVFNTPTPLSLISLIRIALSLSLSVY